MWANWGIVAFALRRIKCGWGEWSLVQATLCFVEVAVKAFPRATHFFIWCLAIKSANYAHDFLDRNDKDYVESFDFYDSEWINAGFKEEPLIYRNWFNECTQKRRFYWSFWAQRKIGWTWPVPADVQIIIGSQ